MRDGNARTLRLSASARAGRTPHWRTHRRDIAVWGALVLAGLALTAFAVKGGAELGTASAPFIGRYRLKIGFGSVLAPLVATGILLGAARGAWERMRWRAVLITSFAASFAWAVSLTLVDGASGLTRALGSADAYPVDLGAVGDSPLQFVRQFNDRAPHLSIATRGHPPAPVLLLWALSRIGVHDDLALGLLLTALGSLAVPLVLVSMRGVCGDVAARRFLPVLVLAPYAVWTAVSMEAVVAMLGAAMMAAGVQASAPGRSGWPAAGWATVAGVAAGVAALFSYAAPWLALSLVCLYFARRRPFLNLCSGFGALIPVVAAQGLGFGWVDGLLGAQRDWTSRVEPYRSAWWWLGISLVALLIAAGPALVASSRKVRNTPGWPFLVGAGSAVLFSMLAGLARGGVEYAWLPFFAWLTAASVAPERQGDDVIPQQVPLAAVGAGVAVLIEAVLATAT